MSLFAKTEIWRNTYGQPIANVTMTLFYIYNIMLGILF